MITCEHCNAQRDERVVFIEMKPGKDRTPWFLCIRCWIEGIRPMNRNETIAVDVVKPPPKKKRAGRSPPRV